MPLVYKIFVIKTEEKKLLESPHGHRWKDNIEVCLEIHHLGCGLIICGVGYSLLSCSSEHRTEGLSGCYAVSANSTGFID